MTGPTAPTVLMESLKTDRATAQPTAQVECRIAAIDRGTKSNIKDWP